MINRQTDTNLVRTALRRSRIVALLGPRQCGKTTLARQFVAAESLNYLSKRQVKAPKVFVRDSGLLHTLLGIADRRDLELHPKVGASWEGYAVEEVLKAWRPDEAYYWATHQGAEVDLVLFKNRRRIGVECKRSDAPSMSPSMRIALDDLRLDRLVVVYPSERRYALADRVEVIPLAELADPDGDAASLFKRRRR
jgi:predicted AAA+ superfamily ATPase